MSGEGDAIRMLQEPLTSPDAAQKMLAFFQPG